MASLTDGVTDHTTNQLLSEEPEQHSEWNSPTSDCDSPSIYEARLSKLDANDESSDWPPYPPIGWRPIPIYNPPPSRPVPLCTFYAQGKCIMGSKCHFRHPETLNEYSNVDHSTSSEWHSGDTNALVEEYVPLAPPGVKFCTFFPLGKCRNGDACPFIHDSAAQASLASNPSYETAPEWPKNDENSGLKPPCRFFSRGTCKNGDACDFLHVTPDFDDGSERGAVNDDLPLIWSNETAQNTEDGWGVPSNANTGWDNDTHGSEAHAVVNGDEQWSNQLNDSYDPWAPSDASTSAQPSHRTGSASWGTNRSQDSARPCKFYAMNGLCRKGDSCSYLHDASASSKPPIESSASASWGTNQSQQSLRPCKFYAMYGLCRKGDSCFYLHDPSASSEPLTKSPLPSPPPSRNEPNLEDEATWDVPWTSEPWDSAPSKVNAPCKFFGQGYCNRGDDCPLLHINPDSKVDEEVEQVWVSQMLV